MRRAFLKIVIILAVIAGLPAQAEGEVDVTIRVKNIQNDKGMIFVAFYSHKDTWLEDEGAAFEHGVPAKEGEVLLVAPSVAVGKYSIAVFHDENSNGELDTSFIGVPTEGVGISRGASSTFGPPDFEDALLDIRSPVEYVINMEY